MPWEDADAKGPPLDIKGSLKVYLEGLRILASALGPSSGEEVQQEAPAGKGPSTGLTYLAVNNL